WRTVQKPGPWFSTLSSPFPCLRCGLTLFGIRRPRLAEPAQAAATLLAIAFLGSIGRVPASHPDAPFAALAEKHHIRHINGHLFRKPSALRIAAARAKGFVNAIHAFDHNLAFACYYTEHPTHGRRLGCSRIVAGNDHHGVVFANVHAASLQPNATLVCASGLCCFGFPLALAPRLRVGLLN